VKYFPNNYFSWKICNSLSQTIEGTEIKRSLKWEKKR
jgi:hypothetical protein